MQIGDRNWWAEKLEEAETLLRAPAFAYLRETRITRNDAPMIGDDTDQQLFMLERRVGRPLCSSYRELLLAARRSARLAPSLGPLLPPSAVDLYQRRDFELVRLLIDSWRPSIVSDQYQKYDPETGRGSTMDYRGDHINDVLEITQEQDEITIVLDPLIVNSDGEWEAWYFGPGRIQGAIRYRSLPELARDRLKIDAQWVMSHGDPQK